MRKLLKYVLVFLSIQVSVSGELKAQDPHFSQFYNSPMTLNPALTGLLNTDLRLVANYRTQWASVGKPFRTMAISADFPVLRNMIGRDFMGVGFLLMNDAAGVSNLRNTQFQLSFAYSKALTHKGNNLLSLGAQLGYAQQRINYNDLLFDNQFDGGALNPGLPNGEVFLSDRFSYLDFSGGITWSMTPDRYNSYYLGAAVYHLNEPRVSFYDNAEELLYRRTTLFAGAEMRVHTSVSLLPRAVYLRQGPASELNMGMIVKLYMNHLNDFTRTTALHLGTMYRFGDALVLISRLDTGPFGISFSYDINISSLSRGSNGRGGTEIALMYRHQLQTYNRRIPVRCPSF